MLSYKRLYEAVVIQILIDYLYAGKDVQRCIDQKEAEKWLTEGGEDFVDVCGMADIDETKLHNIVKSGDKNKLRMIIRSHKRMNEDESTGLY